MNSLGIAAVSCLALYLGYLCYGRFMVRLWDLDPNRKTPAVEAADGVDYIPARHWTVLFGHHFASIAGAAPIVGPAMACAVWRWLPALLWIVIGSIFMGAVHDFSSLMASLRARGRSIAEIAEENLGHRVRLIFGGFLWLALILVVAVFAHLGAQSLTTMPQVVIPTLGVILAAILVGIMIYRWNVSQWIATVVGLALLFGFIVLGYFVPITLPFGSDHANALAWTVVLLVYAYFASITPVNLLLQPRDYLSTFVLYLGLIAGYLGLLLTHPNFQTPPVQQFSGSLGPLWPMLFVTIACGAISGFHSLIASGTTSKQLASEADATRITRYIGEELFAQGMGIKQLHNRFLSTAIIIALAFYLALGPRQIIWPVFASANQLIAALALVVVTVVLWRRRRPTVYTLVPAVFVLATTAGALVYQTQSFLSTGKVALAVISVALLVLALLMVFESVWRILSGRSTLPAQATAAGEGGDPQHTT